MTAVEKNKNYVVDITGMTHEAQGVGRIEGFTVFVDGALPEETVEVKIIKIAKNYAVGKLINIIKSSPDRIKPFCGCYPRCGGCSLQHLDYGAQLKFKTSLVKESIKRIGKIDDIVVHDTIGMKNPLNYRNKAQYPVGMGKDGILMGFYASRSHDIIGNLTCGIQNPLSDRVKKTVRKFIAENGISVYDETTGNGLVRHVATRVGFKTGEVMVVIVINGEDLPKKKKLVDMLNNAVPGLKSVYLNINTRKTNVILGERSVKLYGSDAITDYVGKFRFNISPTSFFQVNPAQTEVLYEKVLEYTELTGNEIVFDLYCGIGTIALFLSEKAKKVYGVEIVEEAVVDARKNAELNGVANAKFYAGEVEKIVPELYRQGVRADVAVVDPPRKGCDEVLLNTLADMRPQRIVYVSCNPSTLARDLKYLADRGYAAVEAQPVDMFPWTHHVECVVLMTNVKYK